VTQNDATWQNPVRLCWPHRRNPAMNMQYWREVTTWLVTNFGAPGGCYTVTSTQDYMIVDFDRSEDQMFFILRWGNDGF